MKLKLNFHIDWRLNQPVGTAYDDHLNDVVVSVGKVEVARIPIERKGGIFDEQDVQEVIAEAVAPFIERMFAPIQEGTQT